MARERIDLRCHPAHGTAERLGAGKSGFGVLRQERRQDRVRKGPRGQYSVCRLPDGHVVDEWAYFREMRAKRPR